MTERSRKWPEVRRNDGPRSRSESSHDGGYGGYSGGYGSERRGAGPGTTIVTATTGAEVDPMEACTLEEAAPEAGPRAATTATTEAVKEGAAVAEVAGAAEVGGPERSSTRTR